MSVSRSPYSFAHTRCSLSIIEPIQSPPSKPELETVCFKLSPVFRDQQLLCVIILELIFLLKAVGFDKLNCWTYLPVLWQMVLA